MVNLKYKFVFKFFFLRLDKHADQDMFKFSFQIDQIMQFHDSTIDNADICVFHDYT